MDQKNNAYTVNTGNTVWSGTNPRLAGTTSVFRIFQETLTNIARHAQASEVVTSLTENNHVLELVVKDNGKGITKEQIDDQKSFGLLGIQERAYFCGGEAAFIGEKGSGTTVKISVPLVHNGEKDNDTSTYR